MKTVTAIAIIVSGFVVYLGIDYGLLSETGLMAALVGIFGLGGFTVNKENQK